MAKRPRLDLRRLARDAAAAPGARREALAPGGRPATGLMEAVRENLDALLALQASSLTWDAVAAGLSAQGFTTADGRTLTGRNLTGVISSVRRQARRRAAKDAARHGRGDLTGERMPNPPSAPVQADGSPPPRPTLSADLSTVSGPISSSRPTEDERRRAALARAKSLLRKD